ncbi:hypothetical protein [Actinoplanes sp. NPDC049118]|uniref:hypothetical protein n=1 Tax=Actinoplanes sp. NPDC049118 TaxID=3155769 RepID=UPI003407D6F5
MITDVDQPPSRWARIEAGYRRWETRTSARFSHWSVRRRWTIFVLLPTLLICCGGTVAGVPVAWVLGETIKAGRGATSPDAAANDYLMALSYDNEDGLLAILDDDHQDELLAQWHAYRDTMAATDPPPSHLDFGSLIVGPRIDARAEVTTEVSATWWSTHGGSAGGYRSDAYTWRFQTREDNGWQVSAVEAPTWCGGYVRVDACSVTNN